MAADEIDGRAVTIPLPGDGETPVFPTEMPDPRIGKVVAGRYLVISVLGRGGMGTIYEVESQTTGKHFALKTLLPGLGSIDEIAQRFEREARAASLLNHPNIVSVVDFGRLEDGGLFIVMELARGMSLADLLEVGPLEPVRALRIGRGILEALVHAHTQGVIHRDLKPENVMLVDAGASEEEKDLVKLVDFGIAKVVGDARARIGGETLTQAGLAFGTPDYMAPEQAMGEAVDARADLYSMGAILFELLTGRKPYVNEDKLAVLRMHVTRPVPSLSEGLPGRHFPHEVEALVRRALAKRREERFASADEMIRQLDEADRAFALHDDERVPDSTTFFATETAAPPAKHASWQAVLAKIPRRTVLPVLATVGVLGAVALWLGTGPGPRPSASSGGLSAIAASASARLRAGDPAGAAALLEDAIASPETAGDAGAHLVLGHARARLSRGALALGAYERALALDPKLAAEPELLEEASRLLGDKDHGVALAALEFLANRLGARARPIVLEQASRGKVSELRHRAFAIAQRDDFDDRIDRVESYGLDLAQGDSCRERRDVIPKLVALGDRRAIPVLKKARGRKGGFLGFASVNDCLERDAAQAITTLESLP